MILFPEPNRTFCDFWNDVCSFPVLYSGLSY